MFTTTVRLWATTQKQYLNSINVSSVASEWHFLFSFSSAGMISQSTRSCLRLADWRGADTSVSVRGFNLIEFFCELWAGRVPNASPRRRYLVTPSADLSLVYTNSWSPLLPGYLNNENQLQSNLYPFKFEDVKQKSFYYQYLYHY